jgi:peptidoglycan/LPS O-acetylase OafA/YrhL
MKSIKIFKSFDILKFIDISKINRVSYRSDINGLRAIAVLGVVFYHLDLQLFKGGWLGVDVFFVISGFLISNIIISELNQKKFSFKNFYIRRIRRIIPALFSTIILSLPLAYWLLTPRAMLQFSSSITASIFFYSNYYFQNLDFYNAEPTKFMPLLHTWSLAIEEQFYIIFPLFCFIIYKTFKRYTAFCLIAVFLFSIFLNSTTNDIIKFYQIQFRAWELVFGSLVMIFHYKIQNKYLNYLGVSLIIFSYFYFDDSMMTLNSIEPRLLAVLGSGMVLGSSNNNVISKTLSNKYLAIVGVTSYSIYLFHQPIFAFFRLFEERYFYIDKKFSIFVLLLFILCASYINWKYVELFFQKNTKKALLFFVFFCVSIVFLFIYLSSNSNGYEIRYDYVPDEVLYYSQFPNIYPQTFESNIYLFRNKDCDYKILSISYCHWYESNSDKTIYLVGDSHTNALSVSFLKNLKSAQGSYNLVFLSNTLGRCLLSQQSDTVGNVEECEDDFFGEFINTLNKDKDIVIAFGRYDTWLSFKGENEIKCIECDYISIFSNRLEIISRNTSKFIIIEPIPTYPYSIADSYLYKKNTWGEPITLSKNNWIERMTTNNNFFSTLSLNDTKFIPTIPIFCDFEKNEKCYASTKNELYYSDSNHLTLEGANLITYQVNNYLLSLEK